MSIVTKEAMLFDVVRHLSRALRMRIEPWLCHEDEFKMTIDRRWRLHLSREQLETLFDAIGSDAAMVEAFDALKQDHMEFVSYQR